MIPRRLGRDVTTSVTDDDNEFSFIIAVLGAQFNVGRWANYAAGKFGEDQRVLWQFRIRFISVGLVVQTDPK